MGYEIDFLPVGEGGKAGDAIAFRYGNLFGKRSEQFVGIIDGGYKANGDDLVTHINQFYKTNEVDLVILTHPDNDHSSGLTVVLEKMNVKELWMHRPWAHTYNIANMFKDGRVTDNSISNMLKDALQSAHDLEKIAIKKGIPIQEPFVDLHSDDQTILVLGPTEDYYESLLPDFPGTPETIKEAALQEEIDTLFPSVETTEEYWNLETLDDDGVVSPANNSSTIILLAIEDSHLLFTGDAGIPALTNAIALLEKNSYNFSKLKIIQVPHHGSKRNIGPTILNKLIGPILSVDKKIKTAFVSISKVPTVKHPAKKVLNAFRRRGCYVYKTNGNKISQRHEAPDRNWSSASPFVFFNEVEK